MFLPYLRVVPMHLTIGLAAALGMQGTLAGFVILIARVKQG